jgi:hypothetical protein
LTAAGAAAAGEVVRIEEYEAAGISGLRALWDIPVVLREDGRAVERDGHLTALWLPEDRTGKKRQVGYGELMAASLQGPEERLAAVCEAGALAFDALHRKMLVRFPRATDVIANKIAAGHAVAKIELVLPFRDTELHSFGGINWPLGYAYRMNWGVKDWWSRVPPNWHAVAWALRKPWVADHRIGPTYNAHIRGGGYSALSHEARAAGAGVRQPGLPAPLQAGPRPRRAGVVLLLRRRRPRDEQPPRQLGRARQPAGFRPRLPRA